MVFDPATYTPGDGHIAFDENGPASESAPAPDPAPGAAAPKTGDEARYAWMKAQAEKRAAAAPAPAPGEAQPAAEEQQQQEDEQQQQTGEPFRLQVPTFVSQKEITPERQSYVTEFQQLAPEVGIDAATAQGLLDVAVDSAVALDYTRADPDATADDARSEMSRLFGEKAAQGLIANAQRYANARGEAFKKYLDTTGLGSDPAVLVALAFAESKYFTYTPAQAQEQIQKIMATPEYSKGDRLVQIKLHVLSRIAYRTESPEEQLNTAAKAKAAKPAAPSAAGAQSEGDARAEISKLLDPKGPLLRGGPGQAEAKARYFELLRKI